MYIHEGRFYLEKEHIHILNTEPEYVKVRYHAVAVTLSPICRMKRKRAAQTIGISRRQFQRIVKRFKEEGILGFRNRSKRPHRNPNSVSDWLENIVVKIREETGFGPLSISVIANVTLNKQGRTERIAPRTVTRILIRKGIIEAEKRAKKNWRRFEWGHPNRLIQADLTSFNGTPILTSEDDHSRKGWAVRLANRKDKTVVRGMKKLLRFKYDNLLTDNGSQFNRKNKVIREYCDDYLNERHIWSSIHHPETLGKLSAFQKGLKRFLHHKLGSSNDIHEIDHYIDVYVHWYNNGRYHSGIKTYPEVRYSGQRDMEWYSRLIQNLNLGEILTLIPEG